VTLTFRRRVNEVEVNDSKLSQSSTVNNIISNNTVAKWTCSFCSFLNINTISNSSSQEQLHTSTAINLLCEICDEPYTQNPAMEKTHNTLKRPLSDVTNTITNSTIKTTIHSEPNSTVLPLLSPPLCYCREICSLTRVRKTGPTMHRLFWACNHNHLRTKKCDYFHWADGLFPKCKSHKDVVCILRRVLKDGSNNGRYFFSCPLTQSSSSCGTFIWADRLDSSLTAQSDSYKDSFGSGLIRIPL